MLLPLPLASIAAIVAVYASIAHAQYDQALVGTWTTKSMKVMTGPGFYDPVDDKFIEPELTGISYSFTSDGWYEEAYYRAISNPTTPACPSAIMQWQHGRYSLPGNGSIILEPIEVDGRQLTSTPCSYATSLYVRYSQAEMMKKYLVYTDSFHNVQRLDLYQFDGKPLNPMFLIAQPPEMLPTQTLNPTTATTSTSAQSTGKVKRDAEREQLVGTVWLPRKSSEESHPADADRWFWAGIAMVGVGTVMYLLPTSK